jgi:hypothetical protein
MAPPVDGVYGVDGDLLFAVGTVEAICQVPWPQGITMDVYGVDGVSKQGLSPKCCEPYTRANERYAISEFAEHYHRERNHQGLDNRIIRPEFVPHPQHGQVRCRDRLGGLLNYYHRPAA